MRVLLLLSLLLLRVVAAPPAAAQPAPVQSAPAAEPAPALLADTRRSWTDAERSLRAALRLNPGEASFHAGLGEALRYQERTAEAIDAYRRALELAPDSLAYRVEIAHLLLQVERWADAEVEFQRALQLAPRSAALHAGLGDALRAQGKVEEARREYRHAEVLEPYNPTWRRLRDATEVGAVGRWMGEFDAGRMAVVRQLLIWTAASALLLAALSLAMPLLAGVWLLLVAVPLSLLRDRGRRARRQS